MKNKKEIIIKRFLVFGLILAFFSLLILPNFASAADLTSIKDTLGRNKKNIQTSNWVSFVTPTGIANTNTIILTWPAGFTIPASIAGVTISDNGGADNAVTSCTGSGQVLTITASASSIVAAGHTALIKIPASGGVTNHGTAGSYVVSIAGSFNDTGSFGIAIADEDQVSISATVNPYITFNVTQPTVALGLLDSTTVKSGTATMTAATNASGGYIITISGATLTSTPNTIAAIGGTAANSSAGTEQFGLNLVANTTPSVGAAPSGGSGAAVGQYAITNKFAFLTADTVANSAGGPSATTTFTMSYIANITETTKAGSYTAIHTYTCTGTF